MWAQCRFSGTARGVLMKRKVGNVLLGLFFAVAGIAVRIGALNFTFLREAWQNSVLCWYIPDKDSALIWIGIGLMIIVSNLLAKKEKDRQKGTEHPKVTECRAEEEREAGYRD